MSESRFMPDIELLVPDDWRLLRRIRLTALKESPESFLAQYAEELTFSQDRWRSEFVAMGKALGGGSGWVILAYSPRDKRLVNQWAADHTTNLAGGRPVLVLDMYEHAYHMDYGAKAAAYVDAYMEAIRWENAAKLYERFHSEA